MGKLPSLRQKLLNEPTWEVGRHKTSIGTVKKPVFLELRISIKEEWDISSEQDEFETTTGYIHGDSEQAARMWKWISREELWLMQLQ